MSKLRELAAEAAEAATTAARIQREQERERAERSAIQQATRWFDQHLLPVDEILELDVNTYGTKVHVVIDDVHLEWVDDWNASSHNNRTPGGTEKAPACFVIIPVVALPDGTKLYWQRTGGSYTVPFRSMVGLGEALSRTDKPAYTGYRMATDKEVAAWVKEHKALRLGFPS
jgi:type II secretory pathway pseudopilin PulG